MYVLLDGFDLGVGILFLLRRAEPDRDIMIASLAPIWDFNETWLVLGGTVFMAAFPGAFAVAIPAVYFPIALMLVGLLFRGVAFEFREVPGARKWLWNRAFGLGSLLATLAQGAVLGAFVEGFASSHGIYTGTSWDWVRPFPVFCSLGLAAGYTLQGATWLVLKTEHELQAWARSMARRCLIAVLLFIAAVSVWTPLADARIAARWFTWPDMLAFSPVPIITGVLAWWLVRSLNRQAHAAPFVCSVGLFFLSFSGLVVSLWPYAAPPNVTLWDAASAQGSQDFLIIGTMFILPILLMYVCWSYWVFRGKVRGGGYH
jgi:cytochrome bd-type quinol oxidase subunit 2